MERFRFLIAVFFGTLFYTLISLVGGEDGLLSMRQLEAQRERLSENTASIEKIHDTLTSEEDALENDPDTIAAYARKLGYVRIEDPAADGGAGESPERLIKVKGLAVKESQVFDTGTVLKHTEPRYIPEWICKVFGACVMALSYFLLLLFDIQRGYIGIEARKHTGEGSRVSVYDKA